MCALSIITPVYNTASYLPDCFESILSQSFQDFELLLVDDGSTDGSGDVCDIYAQRDSRIRVFHKENGGVSSARNLALDNAKGEWVYFVDSDDELLPNGLETMVNCTSDDVDIVLAGYERYNIDGSVLYKINDRVITVLEKKESLSTLYENHGLYYNYLSYGCIRLLRNKIIQSNHLRFDQELANKEDTLFLTQYIIKSNGITRFTTTPVYRYNEREDSAMGVWKRGFDYKYLDSLQALIKMKHEIISGFPSCSEIDYIAKEGIWNRFIRIQNRMRDMGIEDEELKKKMKCAVLREMDFYFFVKRKIRTLKRKWLSKESGCMSR